MVNFKLKLPLKSILKVELQAKAEWMRRYCYNRMPWGGLVHFREIWVLNKKIIPNKSPEMATFTSRNCISGELLILFFYHLCIWLYYLYSDRKKKKAFFQDLSFSFLRAHFNSFFFYLEQFLARLLFPHVC